LKESCFNSQIFLQIFHSVSVILLL